MHVVGAIRHQMSPQAHTGAARQLRTVSDGSSDDSDRNSEQPGADCQPWLLRRRLSADQQRAIIQGARDGIRQKELAQRAGISVRSARRLLQAAREERAIG